MKKRLFLIPLTAGFVLTGCKVTLFGKTFTFFEKKGSTDVELPQNFLKEFQGYKLATSVKDGGRYLLGVYRVNEDLMRFANGDYHRDGNKYFPFYMATVAGTTEGAAEIEVKMVGNDEFTMQVFASGQVWDQKYIGVYSAESTYGNSVMSIALLDSPDQTSYTDPKDSKTSDNVSAKFKFYTTYEEMPAYAPAAPFQFPDIDEEKVPKFMGTGHNTSDGEPDYTSIDCKSYDIALNSELYDLAHLYEKK